MLEQMLKNVQIKKPMIHNITNYVSANDCANLLLAINASAIMAEDPMEVEEITQACDGLVLNLGILNEQKVKAMLLAGKRANDCSHPIVLDPVGVGASQFRARSCQKLCDQVHMSVIRGNLSEIKFLAHLSSHSHGVDRNAEDHDDFDTIIHFSKQLSAKMNAIIIVSGKIDIIADKDKACLVYNGCERMSKITGTGCQLSSLIAAYISANPNEMFYSCIAAVCTMGIAGEIANNHLEKGQGIASYKIHMLDALSNISTNDLIKKAHYEIR